MRSIWIAAAIVALLLAPACADTVGPVTPHPVHPTVTPKQWPDGPLKYYFEQLQRPDNHRRPNTDGPSRSCCGAGDVVETKFKVERGTSKHPDDLWYAWIKGGWAEIPPETIVPDYAPDGQAYLFMLTLYGPHGESYDQQIVCFVRPNGGL